MLLSRHTRLVAAFDHRHVFIDPTPDEEASYAERQRLFGLERSSWDDYDRSKISKGGGIWPRSAKSIQLSREAREAIGTDNTRLTPNDLISATLKAPVDLLWNGGIGTYIKASSESHADVGDKGNDALRVDGEELRCRVVGEGGNLGVTQLGRVEFAAHGGCINTDAIDNSGGVDCSDHEVNIKILLNRVVDNGDLTMKQRNKLLVDMTEEVAELVLRSNYGQTQALTLLEDRSVELLDEHTRFMRELERAGRLDRAVEHLPNDEELGERSKANAGLTRPELAVLLAYAKIEAYEAMRRSDLVDTGYLAGELMDYFPGPIRKRFPDPVRSHSLRSEIIATVVTNHVVNRMGATFFYRIQASTGVTAPDAARAYFAARDIFRISDPWQAVDELDNQVPASVQTEALERLCHLQERATLWLLRNLPSPLDVEETVQRIRPAVAQLEAHLSEMLPERDHASIVEEADSLRADGIPEDLARRIVSLETLYAAMDLVKVSADTDCELERAARIYFAISTELELDWLREVIAEYEVENPWHERYRMGLEEEFYVQLRVLAMRVIRSVGSKGDAPEQVRAWTEENSAMAERLRRTLEEIRGSGQLDLSMLGVALQELRNLAQAGSAHQVLAGTRQEDRRATA